jgi:hypothetical protein
MMESITMDELTTVLKNLKSNKAPGEASINLELFKYTSHTLLTQEITFLNVTW